MFDGVFRYVRNYPFTFTTFAKGRWLKKPLYETFIKEFKAFSPEYYKKAIESGRISVNGKTVGCDYVLQNSDKIEHITVRKELPVYDIDIEVLFED
jgi:23S rRNA-/tRNA-specific pseudouridylate synthase